MMSRTAALPFHSGLQGLQSLYGRHGFAALAAAVDLHLFAVAAYLLTALLAGKEDASVSNRPSIFIDRPGVPANPVPRNSPVPKGSRRPDPVRKGAITPVATPVSLDDSEIIFSDLPPAPGLNGGVGSPGDSEYGPNDNGSPAGSPGELDLDTVIVNWVEKPPIPVKIVKPEYPEAARRIGLEGTVIVRVLVEKNGRTSMASIVRSNNDIFNERAEQAALQWVFVPGMMTRGPVRVWTTIPFRFTLER